MEKPAPLNLIGNLSDNLKLFKREVEVYFKDAKMYKKPKIIQVVCLLNLLGSDGLKLYKTLKGEKETVQTIFKCLEVYCALGKDNSEEQRNYFTRKQGENEAFDKFYADLCELIKSCSFGKAEETMLRTSVILGIKNKDHQFNLLHNYLPLTEVVKYCQAVEQTKPHHHLVQKENSSGTQVNGNNELQTSNNVDTGEHKKNIVNKIICRKCARYHLKNACPAYAKNCKICGKLNHFAVRCHIRFRFDLNNNNRTNRRFQIKFKKLIHCNKCNYRHFENACPARGMSCKICHQLDHFAAKCYVKVKDDNGCITNVSVYNKNKMEYLSLSSIETERLRINWAECVVVNDKKMLVKLYTGVQFNVMPVYEYKQLNSILEKSSLTIKSRGGFEFKSLGKVNVTMKNSTHEINTYFEVFHFEELPILGLDDCLKLNYKIKGIENQMNELNEINEMEIIYKCNKIMEDCKAVSKK